MIHDLPQKRLALLKEPGPRSRFVAVEEPVVRRVKWIRSRQLGCGRSAWSRLEPWFMRRGLRVDTIASCSRTTNLFRSAEHIARVAVVEMIARHLSAPR